MVNDATTEELPDGKKAWANLKKKDKRETAQTLIKLKREFTASRLESWKNYPPISKLEVKRKRLNEMKPMIIGEDMLIHILNNLRDEDINKVELLKRRAGTDDDPLTLFDLQDEFTTRYLHILK